MTSAEILHGVIDELNDAAEKSREENLKLAHRVKELEHGLERIKMICSKGERDFDQVERIARASLDGANLLAEFKFEGHVKIIQVIERMVAIAVKYGPDAIQSVNRNSHMNKCNGGAQVDKKVVDALLVDFINYFAACHGVDYALKTRDIF